jgi:5-methylcytosine-specific restriction endonuclease McrA
MPIHVLLAVAKDRHGVKTRLLQAGILENVCSACGLRTWRDQPISMHLDHINGVRDDHRLENLRMLCPNCHSQTPTYGGKNRKILRKLQGQDPVV